MKVKTNVKAGPEIINNPDPPVLSSPGTDLEMAREQRNAKAALRYN